MSNKERAIQLLDVINEEQMVYVINVLENLADSTDIPNADTLAAFREVDEMKRNGSGRRFQNLDALWASLEE